jgi:aryl-alcohol dehydrogenase-like predicted oxidoreductase
MKRRILGGTGMSVSEFALGAMMFGAMGNTDHDESVRMIHTALDAGINFVDTADVYSRGESEEIVGRALQGRRDGVVLATKFGMPMGADDNQRGGSPRWIKRAVEDSLRRLGTDYIDLYQMHRPDYATDIGESLAALSDLVRQGKVRAIGCLTFPAELIVEAHWAAARAGLHRFRTEQPPRYSIVNRTIEAACCPSHSARHGRSSPTGRWPAAGCQAHGPGRQPPRHARAAGRFGRAASQARQEAVRDLTSSPPMRDFRSPIWPPRLSVPPGGDLRPDRPPPAGAAR